MILLKGGIQSRVQVPRPLGCTTLICRGKHILSKTAFNYGNQCLKQLFLNKHYKKLVTSDGQYMFKEPGHDEGQPVFKEPFTEHEQQIIDSGKRIGVLAQSLFLGGVDCSPASYFDFSASLLQTRKLVALRMPVLYEASFEAAGVVVAVDILVRAGDAWHLHEVKSSTRVKPEQVLDVALQSWVLQQCGVHLASVNVVHVNSSYCRQGALDVKSLFVVQDVTKEAHELHEQVAEQVALQKLTLEEREVPAVDIGPHCSAPYSCKFKTHCYAAREIPRAHSVLDLKHAAGRRQWALLHDLGVTSTLEVPPDFELSPAQRLQVQVDQSPSQQHVDKAALRAFLAGLTHPLAFLDFETIAPAVPPCDACRPYEQLCFQYSLHLQTPPAAGAGAGEGEGEGEGGLQHLEYLAEEAAWTQRGGGGGGKDPQEGFIRALLRDLGEEHEHEHEQQQGARGSILVYNQSFEDGRLKAIAEKMPEVAAAVTRIRSRLVDLADPFRQMHVYRSAMRGSYSLKRVLPAMLPSWARAYEDLEVSGGGQASGEFLRLVQEAEAEAEAEAGAGAGAEVGSSSRRRRDEVRRALLEYCKLDTLAMVLVLEQLQLLAEEDEDEEEEEGGGKSDTDACSE